MIQEDKIVLVVIPKHVNSRLVLYASKLIIYPQLSFFRLINATPPFISATLTTSVATTVKCVQPTTPVAPLLLNVILQKSALVHRVIVLKTNTRTISQVVATVFNVPLVNVLHVIPNVSLVVPA